MATNSRPEATAEPDLAVAARRIDEIASGAMELFKQAGSFEAELAVAQAVAALRAALSPEVMAPILSLMNSDLGFRTDRDPRRIDRSTGRPFEPYPIEVVRECFIESRLRGFHACGNEWNILNGRFYACRNGFRRKLTDGGTFPGLADLRDWYDVPRLVGDKGAIVKCCAEWILFGRPDSLEREFPIRMRPGLGADAILGKAERKLLRAVHDRLLGLSTPEAEIGDESASIEVESRPASVSAPADAAGPLPEDVRPAWLPGPEHRETAAPRTPQQELALLLTENGFTFEHLQIWGEESGNVKNAMVLVAFDQLPAADCQRLLRNPHGVLAACEAVRARNGGTPTEAVQEPVNPCEMATESLKYV